jgi:hypothetical protein
MSLLEEVFEKEIIVYHGRGFGEQIFNFYNKEHSRCLHTQCKKQVKFWKICKGAWVDSISIYIYGRCSLDLKYLLKVDYEEVITEEDAIKISNQNHMKCFKKEVEKLYLLNFSEDVIIKSVREEYSKLAIKEIIE